MGRRHYRTDPAIRRREAEPYAPRRNTYRRRRRSFTPSDDSDYEVIYEPRRRRGGPRRRLEDSPSSEDRQRSRRRDNGGHRIRGDAAPLRDGTVAGSERSLPPAPSSHPAAPSPAPAPAPAPVPAAPNVAVELCGVDLSVTAAHLVTLAEYLIGSRPLRARRPALEGLSAAVVAAEVDQAARQEGKGVLSGGGVPTARTVEMGLLPAPACLSLPFVPSPDLVSQTLQALQPNGLGGVVTLEWPQEETEAAHKAANALHGAVINGRRVTVSALRGVPPAEA